MSEKEHNALILKKKLMEDEETVKIEGRRLSIDDEEADYEDNNHLFSTDSDSDFEVPHEHDLFTWTAQRNMAEGISLNNSFTGPYPTNMEGLHIDKGKNF